MGEIYGFIARGGLMMIPIILGSVIGLALFLERVWSLRRSAVVPEGFTDRIVAMLRSGRRSEALAACKGGSQYPIARISAKLIEHPALGTDEAKSAVEAAGKRESAMLYRFTEALGTIATIEPLMGLLGTVQGMIMVFQQVASHAGQGTVDPGKLAEGIWTALITTAAGLLIAIPIYVGYKYILARADRMTMELEQDAAAVQLAISAGGSAEREDDGAAQ